MAGGNTLHGRALVDDLGKIVAVEPLTDQGRTWAFGECHLDKLGGCSPPLAAFKGSRAAEGRGPVSRKVPLGFT